MTGEGAYRTTTTMVVCPVCKGHGEVRTVYPPMTLSCHVCKGDRILEEVVILRRAKGRE